VDKEASERESEAFGTAARGYKGDAGVGVSIRQMSSRSQSRNFIVLSLRIRKVLTAFSDETDVKEVRAALET